MVILNPSKRSCYGDLVPNCEMIPLRKPGEQRAEHIIVQVVVG